jgi:type I restriction enzyme, S subunit
VKAVEGWEKGTLGQVAQLTMGQSPDSRYYSEEENGLPFLQGCAEFGARFPKYKMYCSQAKKLAHVGAILFSVRAPVGKINIADRDYIIGRGLAAISGKDIDQSYLEHYLIFEEEHIQNVSQGSTFGAINSSELNGWPINYPIFMPEQTKIAEILSTVDRAIEQTEALIAKQQRIKTGLMQDLLTRGIYENNNLRSEQTHRFKDSPLGRIPVEWSLKRIGDVFEIQLGKMLSQKATEGRSPFFYLGNKNVQWDYVDTSGLQMMDFNDRERIKFELKFNDILVCEGGEVGRAAIWRGEVESCYYQKAVHRLRPIDGQFLPSLFPRFMKWCIRDGLLSDYTSQTSIAHLTQEKLAAVPIMVPTLPEQRKLNAAFDQLDDELSNQTAKLSKLSSLKNALMQDLLTGKKRVTPLLADTMVTN